MQLPLAYPRLPSVGVLRRTPEDFDVDECLEVMPTGAGEHLFVRVEKRGLNTIAVAQMLADAARVPLAAVSYAGMKDRQAVARQWFSVHTPESSVGLPTGAGVSILEQARHVRKLRRGQLLGNRFRIVLRDVTGDRGTLEARLAELRDRGAPNYFGPQRFGYGDANLVAARQWLESRPRRRPSAYQRGILLSAARSWLFNQVLAERVRRGDWDQIIDGDVVEGHGPTGPLWGRGRSRASGACAAVEEASLATEQSWLEPLEHVGLNQQRRTLGMRPDRLCWGWDQLDLELTFGLSRGCYATSLLAELGRFEAPVVGAEIVPGAASG